MRVVFLLLLLPLPVHAEDLGELSANPAGLSGQFSLSGYLVSLVIESANQMNETNQTNKINQFRPFSPYGSLFSNKSATNPFATDAPRLYDQQGNYRGKLSANPYDPDSTSNPYGRYGSPFSGQILGHSTFLAAPDGCLRRSPGEE